jgi:hypothetical protein
MPERFIHWLLSWRGRIYLVDVTTCKNRRQQPQIPPYGASLIKNWNVYIYTAEVIKPRSKQAPLMLIS